ncbi:hypothetical protein EVAR_67464_1 [Eumeta japonica]|uniref:Uncharacterized protein n=1 Tax=Eumeta variegata TaxID=151549 RepID=A0A4C1ZUD7_EUMVA|nr:hypothetical protein EVAR_67464_1 [Eumeta japonica]
MVNPRIDPEVALPVSLVTVRAIDTENRDVLMRIYRIIKSKEKKDKRDSLSGGGIGRQECYSGVQTNTPTVQEKKAGRKRWVKEWAHAHRAMR